MNVLKIAKINGIKVIKNCKVNILEKNELGVAVFTRGQWYIVYDETQSVAVKRFVIAHELGHILLGHPLREGLYGNSFSAKKGAEKEADSFAVRLLCPACVLWKTGKVTAKEIATACGVPEDIAQKRAKRMKTLLERNAFLTHKLERQVYEGFRDYIEQNRPGQSDISPTPD